VPTEIERLVRKLFKPIAPRKAGQDPEQQNGIVVVTVIEVWKPRVQLLDHVCDSLARHQSSPSPKPDEPKRKAATIPTVATFAKESRPLARR
jgi:hypothetical protein